MGYHFSSAQNLASSTYFYLRVILFQTVKSSIDYQEAKSSALNVPLPGRSLALGASRPFPRYSATSLTQAVAQESLMAASPVGVPNGSITLKSLGWCREEGTGVTAAIAWPFSLWLLSRCWISMT